MISKFQDGGRDVISCRKVLPSGECQAVSAQSLCDSSWSMPQMNFKSLFMLFNGGIYGNILKRMEDFFIPRVVALVVLWELD